MISQRQSENLQQAKDAFRTLLLCFSNREPSDEKIAALAEAWLRGGWTAQRLKLAIKLAEGKHRFPPTIADLRAEVGHLRCSREAERVEAEVIQDFGPGYRCSQKQIDKIAERLGIDRGVVKARHLA